MTQADGYAERDAALVMLWDKRKRSTKRFTPGADKGYDVADVVERLREMNVVPHVARKNRATRLTGARRGMRATSSAKPSPSPASAVQPSSQPPEPCRAFAQIRRTAGPPWTQDHKLAMAPAIAALSAP